MGALLWASDDLWLTMSLGYRVVPAELRALRGPTLAMTAVVNPW